MRSNAHKVVHRAERADRGPFLDDYVPTKRCRICENDMIANHTIMRNVRVRHNQHVIAHAGQAAALDGTAIDGGELTDHVVIPDFEPSRFAGIADVLWGEANRAKRKELIVR